MRELSGFEKFVLFCLVVVAFISLLYGLTMSGGIV